MYINSINNNSICQNSNNRCRSCRSMLPLRFGAGMNKDIFERRIARLDWDSFFGIYAKRNCILSIPLETLKSLHYDLKFYPEVLAQAHLTKINDGSGELLMHKAVRGGIEAVKEIHEVLKDKTEVLTQIHITKDEFGRTPMYNAVAHEAVPDSLHPADLKYMQEIHRAFANHPEAIAKIHLTKCVADNLPIHDATVDATVEIHRVLANQPDTIAKIYLTQNKYGNLPIHEATMGCAPVYGVDVLEKIKEMHSVLEKQPDVIAQIYLTKNKEGKLPIDCRYKVVQNSETHRAIINEIHRAITKAALNSDLDVDTSIKLLETYNGTGQYSDAIKELKNKPKNVLNDNHTTPKEPANKFDWEKAKIYLYKWFNK